MQGGFLGCAANDLMWALFPFLEKHAKDKVSYKALAKLNASTTNRLKSKSPGDQFEDLICPQPNPREQNPPKYYLGTLTK